MNSISNACAKHDTTMLSGNVESNRENVNTPRNTSRSMRVGNIQWTVTVLLIVSIISTSISLIQVSRQHFALDAITNEIAFAALTQRNETTRTDDFSWDDVDLESPGNCGSNKCFFRSSFANQTGYLVGIQKKKQQFHLFTNMMAAWNLSQRLERDYHIRHFYRGPPETIRADDEIRAHLNAQVTQPIFETENRDVAFFGNNASAGLLTVQKVQAAPSPVILVGCVQRELTLRQLPNFTSAVYDKDEFAQQFDKELKNLSSLLEKEPKILFDFQVMINSKGNIYHFDLDRFEQGTWKNDKKRKKHLKSCMEFVKSIGKAAISPQTDVE